MMLNSSCAQRPMVSQGLFALFVLRSRDPLVIRPKYFGNHLRFFVKDGMRYTIPRMCLFSSCAHFLISKVCRTNFGKHVTCMQVVGQSKVGSGRRLSGRRSQHSDVGSGPTTYLFREGILLHENASGPLFVGRAVVGNFLSSCGADCVLCSVFGD